MRRRFANYEPVESRKLLLLCRTSCSTLMPLGDDVHEHAGDNLQEAQLRDWVHNNVAVPYQLTIIRCGAGVSFGRILERADTLSRRGFKTIVVTGFDRLCRGPELNHLLRFAANAGIQIIVTEQIEPKQ